MLFDFYHDTMTVTNEEATNTLIECEFKGGNPPKLIDNSFKIVISKAFTAHTANFITQFFQTAK